MLPFLLVAVLTLGSMPKPRPLPEHPVAFIAQFRPVETCQDLQLPEPINSPHPLLPIESGAKVDFILGYDGLVYSPFFMASYHINEREVLKVVKTWRFHPMMCNGVPVDSEGQVTLIRQ